MRWQGGFLPPRGLALIPEAISFSLMSTRDGLGSGTSDGPLVGKKDAKGAAQAALIEPPMDLVRFPQPSRSQWREKPLASGTPIKVWANSSFSSTKPLEARATATPCHRRPLLLWMGLTS